MLALTIVIIVINLSLGIAIVSRVWRDLSAVIFFLITAVFSLLSLANYYSLVTDLESALRWIRYEMFLAACHTFLFFVFVHLFMRKGFPYSWKQVIAFLAPFIVILAITLSPHLFSGITQHPVTGNVETIPGKLFPAFALWLFITMLLSMTHVVRMYRQSIGVERAQWKYILLGTFSTYIALILFNFIFAGLFHQTAFLPYTPLYSLPIVFATAYAIIKHNLFNIKVLATGAFVSIISVLYFAKILISKTTLDRILDGTIFLATVMFGYLLVRSVKEEIHQREEITKLANELAKTNWELAKKNEELRIIDQRKSEFVSIVSHQLRTPITAIKGYASLLLENAYGVLAKEFVEPIEKIYASSKRLAEMVSDFLDISKIEQGTMAYHFATVDIKALLEDLVKEFRPEAEKKKLLLEFHFPKDEQFFASVDEGKMRQIFSNLLDNAIKYTPKGGVAVVLEKHDAAGTLTAKIKDSGIGLSHDDIHHLFGKFTRGEQGQRENTDGSGLGLYIVKKMLEAQHGKIWVDSGGPGKGTTFVLELPIAPEGEQGQNA